MVIAQEHMATLTLFPLVRGYNALLYMLPALDFRSSLISLSEVVYL